MTNDNDKKEEQTPCDCGGGNCTSGMSKWIWVLLVLAIAGVLIAKNAGKKDAITPAQGNDKVAAAVDVAGTNVAAVATSGPAVQEKPIPRLVDLGAGKCIPCKMMAPILSELKSNYVGRLDVQFIDVWEDPTQSEKYGIKIIPTQIFYDPAGKELFRHEGFFSKEDILGKWKEFGVDLGVQSLPSFSRWEPARKDTRSKDTICYMCDGTIEPNSLVVVKTAKGDVRLCGMHHYFVMYSCLTEEKTDFERKVTVADWATGSPVPITEAAYVYGMDAKTGRPTIKAFSDKAAAEKERQANGGTVLGFGVLQNKELANKCGFCDRAV